MSLMNTGELRRYHATVASQYMCDMLKARQYEILAFNDSKQPIQARYSRKEWFTRKGPLPTLESVKKANPEHRVVKCPPPIFPEHAGVDQSWVNVTIVWWDQQFPLTKINTESLRECRAWCLQASPPPEHVIIVHEKPARLNITSFNAIRHKDNPKDLSTLDTMMEDAEKKALAIDLMLVRVEMWDLKQLLYHMTTNELCASTPSKLLTWQESITPFYLRQCVSLTPIVASEPRVLYYGGQPGQIMRTICHSINGSSPFDRLIVAVRANVADEADGESDKSTNTANNGVVLMED